MKKINQRKNKLQSFISQNNLDSRMSYSLLRFYLLAEKNMRPILLNALSFAKHEQQYCSEISEENAQLRRILGRLSLYYSRRVILGAVSNEEGVRFGENGKPIVDGLNISISHAATIGDMQLCVCTASKDIGAEYGIDIALRDKPISWKSSPEAFISKLRLNKSLGTPNEWDQIMGKNSIREQLNEFYRFWAVKESVLKATGAGASAMRPSRIDIFTETEHPFELGGGVHLENSSFLIDGTKQNARVFEECLTIDNTSFYLAETSLRNHDDTRPHPEYSSISHLSLKTLLDTVSNDSAKSI